jgi:phosphoglucomutase
MFDAVRAGPFKSEMRLGSFKILRWRDMTEGYDSGTPDKKPQLPADKSSQMLTLWLDREVRFTIRASGTEAKVKCKFLTSGAHHKKVTNTNVHRLHRKLWLLSPAGHRRRL